jgi:hypothetical protein
MNMYDLLLVKTGIEGSLLREKTSLRRSGERTEGLCWKLIKKRSLEVIRHPFLFFAPFKI